MFCQCRSVLTIIAHYAIENNILTLLFAIATIGQLDTSTLAKTGVSVCVLGILRHVVTLPSCSNDGFCQGLVKYVILRQPLKSGGPICKIICPLKWYQVKIICYLTTKIPFIYRVDIDNVGSDFWEYICKHRWYHQVD